MQIDQSAILITGGTGSFGHHFVAHILKHYQPQKVVIYSRDEYKQYQMQNRLKEHAGKLRFFIGDVRDKDRLCRAFDGIDLVIHAAALKHVPLMEYNPIEAVKTNINGAESVIDAALDCGVKRVIALSTDKACNPVNLYGATKLVSDKLFVAANAYSGNKPTRFAVVRYGNVAGSRGSVIPYFQNLIAQGAQTLPITDLRMTRFWISLDEAVRLVLTAIDDSQGGEVYVSKIPSFKVTDLAQAMLPQAQLQVIGVRPGEKLHEAMITETDSLNTYEYDQEYIIYPNLDWWQVKENLRAGGQKVAADFTYASDSNPSWLSVSELQALLKHFKVAE